MIEKRPKSWNEIVGQEQPIMVVRAVLKNPRFMTRGLVFEGPFAVGKTSTARITARALLCMSDDPYGCGRCPSCLTPLDNHPSYLGIDAASHSGVEEARRLMTRVEGPATLGKCHVVVVDEAHRLTEPAWDVFLAPLESNSPTTFIFVTSQGSDLPVAITSRTAVFRFTLVPTEALFGLVMSRADAEAIPYTQDGLKAIAKYAKGHPRDAIKYLGLVAACGAVTQELAVKVINRDIESLVRDIFDLILRQDLSAAVGVADLLAQRIGTARLIEEMFNFTASSLYESEPLIPRIGHLQIVTSFFVKWSAHQNLSLDIVPLFLAELSDLKKEVIKDAPAPRISRVAVKQSYLNAEQFRKVVEAHTK